MMAGKQKKTKEEASIDLKLHVALIVEETCKNHNYYIGAVQTLPTLVLFLYWVKDGE
jgi:hypothetical protein